MKTLLRLLCPWIAVGVVCAADAGKPPPSASFRFLSFAELPGLCVKNAKGEFSPVEANTGFIGKPLRLDTSGPIALLPAGKDGAPERTGEKLAPPVVSFAPLAETPRQLVVLFGTSGKAAANVIPDNPARFPFGRVLAVNLTDVPIVAEIGGGRTTLPKGGAVLCEEPGKFVGADNVSVKFFSADSAQTRFYSSVWRHNTELRTLAFIYRNEGGRVVIRTVLDPNVPEFAEAKESLPPAKKEVK